MIDQYTSLSEKFLKKGIWLYIFGFMIAPAGYLIKIIISNDLDVNEVGIIYGIISLITLISAYNDLGMTESLKFFVPKFIEEKRYDKVKSVLVFAFFMQIITSLLIALFFYFGADIISNKYLKTPDATEVLKVFAFFFISINIFQTISNFFLAVQDTFYHKISELIRIFAIACIVVIIFMIDKGSLFFYSFSWVIGLYIGVLFGLTFLYQKYYRLYLKDEKIIYKKDFYLPISKYSLFVLIGASAATLLSQIDMQMIIIFLGTEDAGYYTNYLSIVTIPFVIIGPIFGLLFPIFSELHSKGESKKIQLIKDVFQNNFLIIGISFNILFFIFGTLIAYILFGEKFIQSGEILKYSILLLSFNFLLTINFNILSGIGKVKDRVKIILVGIVCNIISNIILIKIMGVNGAALATGIGWFIIWILSEKELRKIYSSKFNISLILKNVLCMTIIGYLLYFAFSPLFNEVSRLPSLLLFILISILYFIFFIFVNFKIFLNFIQQIKRIKH